MGGDACRAHWWSVGRSGESFHWETTGRSAGYSFIHWFLFLFIFVYSDTKKKDLAVELRDEDGCNSPIWSTLVPTDDDEDAVACRMTNSAQVVLHDRLITDTTTSFKKCTATAPLPSLPSLIFCPSTSHRRTDQQQQHSVYSITIDSRGQVEIVQDTTKPSSKSCIIIPGNL